MNVPDLGVNSYETARPKSDADSTALAKTYNADLGVACSRSWRLAQRRSIM